MLCVFGSHTCVSNFLGVQETKSWNISHTEFAPLGETQRKNNLGAQALFGEPNALFPKPMHSSEQGDAESDSNWLQVCQDTKLYGPSVTTEA